MAGGLDERLDRHGEHPALDWATCDYGGQWDGEGLAYYGLVEIEQHKKTDPAAEFGVGGAGDPWIGPETDELRQVPGLGERALLHGYMSASRLEVLDGGTVLTLTVQWHGDDPGGGGKTAERAAADEDAVAAAMIEDMRALMAALRKG
ncbi:hypothetical protein ACTVZO_26500 [Streptomyces sp. IBSNAI002]|uniref:hypothetical protein n=1 Tax=Streptomyces sp. IBSNAI002 TaxID=3457500 RepID=UPI003FD66579